MSSTRLGLVRCEHCARQFNPHSAARHIPWCAEQQSKNRKQRLSNEKQQALERYKWRISYRPSNQFVDNNNKRPPALNLNLDQRAKKSSVNSSATLSSPSASSATSFSGTSLTSTDRVRNQRRHLRQNQATSTAKPVSQLQRSVSSVTLTKQTAGSTVASRVESSLAQNHHHVLGSPLRVQNRTKSVTDVSYIVETLAKRVDEIYAQNQVLLASISMGNLNRAMVDEDDDEDNNSEGANELEKQPVRCHSCKSGCLKDSNYCHKCGCRLQSASSESSI